MSADKLMSAAEALAGLRDGMLVSTGGWVFAGQPIALVHALIRHGAADLHLMPAPASLAADLLIGARRVARLSAMFVSFEQFGLAPQHRRAAEAGDIEILETDGPGLAAALRAGACDLPYQLIPDLGSDVPAVNPWLYQPVAPQPGERRMFKVRAAKPDFVLLHAQRGDRLGNVQYQGPAFFDPLLAMAGQRVIVSVDQVVPTEQIVATQHLTRIPAPLVHAVVEAPRGAAPTASGSHYGADLEHLSRYARTCGDAEAFRLYLEREVYAAKESTPI